MRMDEVTECPIAETDDKFTEAHYFIERMMVEYHDPMAFRYNLNAFLQALRNVTFVLQKDLSHRDGFQEWYPERREIMKADPLLRKFVDGRNVVVKQRSLEINSHAVIGFFRWRILKIGISMDVPTHVSSRHIVENMAPTIGLIQNTLERASSMVFVGNGMPLSWGMATSLLSAILLGSMLGKSCQGHMSSRDGTSCRQSSMAIEWKIVTFS